MLEVKPALELFNDMSTASKRPRRLHGDSDRQLPYKMRKAFDSFVASSNAECVTAVWKACATK